MESSRVVKRQLAVKYAGNMQAYEHFKRITGASPSLYPHDYLFYNDHVERRHSRNIQELAQLKKLIKEGRVEVEALQFNVYNTYYPSYVLHHHFDVFLPILAQFASQKEAKEITNQGKKLNITGAYFHDKIRLDFKGTEKELPTIDEGGVLQMDKETYFYSAITSPYATHCAFLALSKTGLKLAVVQLRDNLGQFITGITLRDMGAMISDDYLPIGYNFSGLKPLFTFQVSTSVGKKVRALCIKQRLNDFGFSLKDMQKSLYVTMQYTKMRRQFKTVDSSKEQRRLITYQAVATRIINAFTNFTALSDLYSRGLQTSFSYLLLNQLMDSAHHLVLEDLIHLRECCGGFGYMQVSGHPGCIERVCFRAGGETNQKLEVTPQILQATHYFAASDQLERYYCQPFNADKPSYMNLFGAFISIVFNMRRDHGSLSEVQFKREYLRQSCLMAMHGREEFTRFDASNLHCLLLQYSVASYVINRSSFTNLQLIQGDPQLFFQRLNQFRTNMLQKITKELQGIDDALELNYLRNTIVGREDQQQFYSEVVATSKANLRNEKEYLAYVQAPIVEMITTNRAKL